MSREIEDALAEKTKEVDALAKKLSFGKRMKYTFLPRSCRDFGLWNASTVATWPSACGTGFALGMSQSPWVLKVASSLGAVKGVVGAALTKLGGWIASGITALWAMMS